MSSNQATTGKENSPDRNSPAIESAVGSEQGQQILELQAQTLRRLNDEWLRIIRIHLIFAGGIVTGISFIGLESLTAPSQPNLLTAIAWLFTSIFTAMSAVAWLSRTISERPLYTDLTLFVLDDDIDYKTRINFADSKISLLKNLFLNNPTISEFEDYIQKPDSTKGSNTNDYQEAIEHNRHIIKSREEYVDFVHRELNILFLFTLAGIIFLVSIK
ncbi:hypothetical protein [Halomicrococcus sp. SG-WS-1]|uniref:hypothetical protein n=1 Tax=Halomicrococcus sp. SG-WS-1 TaxID=3439057 RepID=UPI003F7A27EB